MTVTAADCPAAQRAVPQLQTGSGVGTCQTCSPVASFKAAKPGRRLPPGITSAIGTYTFCSSAACPHSTPPSALPSPTLVCQSTLPLSGSKAHITPDFCPATNTCLPLDKVRKTGEVPKSTSGPASVGQLPLAPGPQFIRKLS